MTKVKLKNQDAKAVFDDFERFEMFVHERWKWMVTGGIAIVAAVAVYGGIVYVHTQSENKAISVLGVAENEQELTAALTQYPKHQASVRARLRLIRIFTDEKRYDEALAQYSLVLKSDIPKEARWRAELEMAYLQELKGKPEEAAKEFDRIGGAQFIADDIRCEANYAAGRLYLSLKNNADADKCLKRITMLGEVSIPGAEFWQMQARYLASKVEVPAAPAVAAK